MKKKSVAAKSNSNGTAPQVGGTVRGQKKADWPKVGRKRLAEKEDAVETLAKAMKAAREAKKISIGSLASKLDVAPATLIKFEDRHHSISLAVVLELAEQLGYTLTLTKTKTTRQK